MTVTLEQYRRHAERFGTECVYETAEGLGLSALELGHLARHLRRIDPRWRLTATQRDQLIADLLAERLRTAEIAHMAGVSEKTVSRTRQRDLEHAACSSESRLVEPKREDRLALPDDRSESADSVLHGGPGYGGHPRRDHLREGHGDRDEGRADGRRHLPGATS